MGKKGKGAKGKGKAEETKAPRGRAAKRQEEAEIAAENKEKEALSAAVGTFVGDDYDLSGQGWPGYVLLKGQSYHGVGKRRAPKRDIHIDHVYLTVPGKVLLKPETKFKAISGRKYGIIGRNGLGKSVLMTRLSRREEPFQNVPEHITIVHVEQEIQGDDRTPLGAVLQSNREREWLLGMERKFEVAETDESLMTELEALDFDLVDIHDRLREIESHKAESKASRILYGLGFDEKEFRTKKTREFSGGWRMRIALACALFGEPDLLILDEPTNHLDLEACIWLENYLSTWKKSLLLVSHDRDFVNGTVDNIIHLHNQTLTYYKGDFESFMKIRGTRQRELSNKRDAQLRKRKKDEKFVRENRTSNQAKKAKAVKARMAKEEIVEEDTDDPSLVFSFPPPSKMGETAVISIKDVSFHYPGKDNIFNNLELAIYMDSRIGCVGPNGAGKSTLLKLIDGQLTASKGEILQKDHLIVARFHQHHVDQLTMDETPLEYFQSKFDGSPHELRSHLARFGVRGDLALQRISSLSGGQKSRVAFAELAYLRPHVILFDEPTNHMDMQSIDSLVDGIAKFEGAVVVISHNQHIIEAATNELWVVSKTGKVKRYNGDFAEYKDEIIESFDDDLLAAAGTIAEEEEKVGDDDDVDYT
eukprot:CAMPEP_0119122520 /NCGR_PEP_ID=MMETSP1310-20130426/2749_1 /TAXON_ID=464262 /ORGANISM="Genus nov. species nov., Strain RCC2339" /LENGTH=645 /DNA_ID=CAMNT_0007112185 /DNA_START=136 /DNA_END=2073 /DNA_ORIENTATION=-